MNKAASDPYDLDALMGGKWWTEVPSLPRLPDTYLGIDPSLSDLGLGFLLRGAIRTYSWVPPGGVTGPARLAWFHGEFRALFARYAPALVALEGYSFGSIGRQHAAGELGGIIRLCLWEANIPWIEVAPSGLKKFVLDVGKGQKGVILKGLYKRWGIDIDNDNQADACALAIMAAAIMAVSKNRPSTFSLTQAQRDAMQKVLHVPTRYAARRRTRSFCNPLQKSVDKGYVPA